MEGGDGLNPDGAEALHQVPDELLVFDESSDDEADEPAWDFDEGDENFRRRRPPPPAPVPPRGGAGNREGRGGNVNGLDAAGLAAAAERQAQERAMAELRNRPGPERADHAVNRAALQRFLDLVQNDREDEWDSDELDDDDF